VPERRAGNPVGRRMNFLIPAAWSWLGLAVPVIALYLIRQQLERRRVSTLLFWDQLPSQAANSALWRTLRRWLSLLLQLVFLLLVTFALTRPLAPWQTASPSRVVYILDPSASMSAKDGDGRRWDRALERLDAELRQLRAFDRAAILQAGDPPVVLSGWTSSRRVLLDALRLAEPGTTSVSLRPALELAASLQATEPGATVRVLTDGVWEEADEVPPGVDRLIVGTAGENLGVTHFSARRSLVAPDEVRLAVEVRSGFTQPVEGTLEISRGDALVDVQSLRLEPSVPWRREWDVRGEGDTTFAARLTGFPPDLLGVDDEAFVRIDPLPRAKVLVVGEENPYVEAALNALPMVDWARVETVTGYPDPEALYVFYRALPPPDFDRARLILIDPPESGFWGRRDGDLPDPLISDVARESVLMRNTGFDKVAVRGAAKWLPADGATTLADSFGNPVVFGQWDERNRWVVVGFDLAGSDWVLRTAFPIFLGNAIESLRPARSLAPSSAPGPGETALAVTAADAASDSAAAVPSGWVLSFPLWWWALLLACGWLVAEWWTYTRRITE
jgi:hypothetical protein